MVKRVRGVHFWKNFWKIFKNEDFHQTIGTKCGKKGAWSSFLKDFLENIQK